VSAPAESPLFRQRSFAGLWWGQLFSITGDRLTYLALMGLFLQHSSDRASYAALLAVLGNVVLAPVLLLAPFTGAWVDRRNLKHLLIVTDVLRAFVVLAIPWVYAASADVTLVFALVFLLFTLNVAFVPAKSALIPEIVPRTQLLAANSLLAGAGVLATGLGALAGGYIVDRWGFALAMQIDAATYLLSVLGILLIVYRHQTARAARSERSIASYALEVVAGWQLLRRKTDVFTALLALAAVWWAGGTLHVAGNDHIQSAASTPGMLRVGALLFAIGLGTGLGTWWINTRGRHHAPERLLGSGLMLAALAIVLFATTQLFAIFLVAAFLIGLFAAPALILTETTLQVAGDAGERARIFSAKDFIVRLTLLASLAASAWSVAAIGARPTLVVCAALLAVVGFAVFRPRRTRA
jgi:DHA3 family macrolide efflux protein-like MFS transporter